MSHWVSIWGQAHTCIRGMRPGYGGRTCLLTLRSAFDATQLRLRLSNREGSRPMVLVAATVSVGERTALPLCFGGGSGAVLQPGAELASDALALELRRGDYVRVRLAFRGPVHSGNNIRADVHCSMTGDFTAGGQFDTLRPAGDPPVPAVASIEALADDGAGALICFGDSITQMGMWTSPLEDMLFNQRPGELALINHGIGGNRLLHGPASPDVSRYGRAGMERFRRDVLEEPGAAAVVLAMGTNDFGHVGDPADPEWTDAPTLERAFVALAEQAKARGLAVIAATIPPCTGWDDYGPAQDVQRRAFNAWLRQQEGASFERVVDFDAVLRSADRPEVLDMSWDGGDHLHPGPLGGRRMAEALFAKLT